MVRKSAYWPTAHVARHQSPHAWVNAGSAPTIPRLCHLLVHRSQGRPPVLCRGDKGGFFVETLHAALLRAGFDPTFRDADCAEFAHGTHEAVCAFQAARNLPVTGGCCYFAELLCCSLLSFAVKRSMLA